MLGLSTACQTAPKPKPLSQLSEAEQIEIFKYAPPAKAGKKGYDWDNIYKDTAIVVLCIPLVVFYALANSGTQISTGK